MDKNLSKKLGNIEKKYTNVSFENDEIAKVKIKSEFASKMGISLINSATSLAVDEESCNFAYCLKILELYPIKNNDFLYWNEHIKLFSELEKNGIKVICINPFAKDFSRMRKTEELLNAKGLLYSANGLHKVIDLYRFPSYYLISPNKEIVFSTSSIIKDNQIFVEEMQKHLP